MQMLDVAWGKVTTKTVINCFKKAEITKKKKNQSEALVDAETALKISRKNWISFLYINPGSSQKEPPLIISSVWMILSPALH